MTVVGASSVLTALRFLPVRTSAPTTRAGAASCHTTFSSRGVEIAVQQEQRDVAVAAIQRARRRRRTALFRQGPTSYAGDVGARCRGLALRVGERPRVRVVNRLPDYSRRVSDERCDDVHELRKARQPDAIRVPQERVERAADDERVAQVVHFLEQMRRLLTASVPAGLPVPHVPLVERQPEPLRGASSVRERSRTRRRRLRFAAPSRGSTRETAHRL